MVSTRIPRSARWVLAAWIVGFGITGARGDEPAPAPAAAPSTDQMLQLLLKRLDGLEQQNKELKRQLEQATAADSGNSALAEQLRALQLRLSTLEKEKEQAKTTPATATATLPLPSPTTPPVVALPAEAGAPKPKQEFVDLVDGLVDKRLDRDARTAAKKKDDDAKKSELAGFEVGKQMKMSGVWNNGLQFATEDDAFKFHVGGRVDFDNAWYRADKNMVFGSTDSVGLHDGADFRRVRLRTDGRIWDFVDFVFEVNFANLQDFSNAGQDVTAGSVGLTDVNVTFRDMPFVGNIKVGHFLPPISLEHMTSSNFTYYMERSPQFDAFINRFDYANGVNFFNTYLNENATFSWALLRTGSRTVNPFGAGNGDGEYGYAARATFLPIYEDDGRRLFHIGLGMLHRALDNESTSPGDRALVRGGASGNEIPNVMATGRFYAPDGQYYVNPEFAFISGRFSLSGEYLATFLPSSFAREVRPEVYSDPRGRIFYQGYYVEGGWFLTQGDQRRYNRKLGAFDRTVPSENAWLMRGPNGKSSAGRGALQMLARYSFLDLASGDPVITRTDGARAGVEHDVTLGLVWYLNPQSNIQLNYIRTHINSVKQDASGVFDAAGVRFHYDF